MAIPKNINKAHLLKAIEKIEQEGIPSGGDSQYYDVSFSNKKYPPKLIVSYANIFANGKELDRNSFSGGLGTQCFKLLQDNNLEIIKKSNNSVFLKNIWIEKTIVKGRDDRKYGERALGKALWSPQKSKGGADIYKNMREVLEGDIVLHLIDNHEFSGVSIVKNKAVEAKGLPESEWDGPAYLIKLKDYTELDPKLTRDKILVQEYYQILSDISNDSEVFYNKKLELRQGAYLTPCPEKLFSLINNIYQRISGSKLPNTDHFNNSEMHNNLSYGFVLEPFISDLQNSGLIYKKNLLSRFIASLLTKPFVLLTGLSGSGKTKLAQAFVQWICQDESQYCIIPVGADWTNREPLLGYPNALNPEEYVKPDSGVLDLIIRANNKPDLPHFLVLDEMNLSHVERYFADFLSVMESKEEIPLFAEGTVENGVPSKLRVPSNLFIIGTVNIDETTNMFSPKVLDRANTIEFRVTKDEMESFLNNIKDINMEALNTKGAGMAKSFLEMSANKSFVTQDKEEINTALLQFFGELKKTGAEFGYRSASEIMRLINQLSILDGSLDKTEKIDIAIMQKLLPKLHGSRRKLCLVLETLGTFCMNGDIDIIKDVFGKDDYDFNNKDVLYPLSLEKIARMYKGAIDNGFASFAEA